MNDIEILKQIEGEYERTQSNLGWRFLYSPKSTLHTADIVFLGLNPGGKSFETPIFSCETGSAYLNERWGGHLPGSAPLQKQVQTLFRILNVEPDRVLAGNIYPIRAPRWADITDRSAAIQFSKNLWQPILSRRRFCIITMGADAKTLVTRVLSAVPIKAIGTNWGNTKARFYSYSCGSICCLPHLSRYRIFNRGKTDALEAALQNL